MSSTSVHGTIFSDADPVVEHPDRTPDYEYHVAFGTIVLCMSEAQLCTLVRSATEWLEAKDDDERGPVCDHCGEPVEDIGGLYWRHSSRFYVCDPTLAASGVATVRGSEKVAQTVTA